MHNTIRFPFLLPLLLLSTLLATPVWSNDIEAVATVSNTVVTENDVFQLSIEVNDKLANSALDLTPLADDFVYGSPSISQRASIINGKMSQSTVWTLTLQPKNIGNYIIPSFRFNGASTIPISIQVIPADAKQESDQEIQLRASISNEKPYIGESFTYSLELMVSARINAPRLQPPMGDGFEVVQQGKETQYESVINGRRYSIVTINYQITPTKVGMAMLQGAVLSGNEIRGNGYNALSLPFRRAASNTKFDIQDKPADYQGFWLPTSQLELSQTWQPTDLAENIQVGESINRTIRLKINNISQSAMPNLSINYPDSVKVYDSKPSYSTEGDDSIMELNQVIIARQAGEIVLPAVTVTWFNTETKQAQTSRVPGKTFTSVANQAMDPAIIQPSGPEPASTTTTVTVSHPHAGFWPYLSALFAALWLITLAFLLKGRAKTTPKPRPLAAPTASFAELKGAIKAKQIVQINALLQQLDLTKLPAELQTELEAEKQAMLAAHYSASPSEWSNRTLLALVAKAQKYKPNPVKASPLAEL